MATSLGSMFIELGINTAAFADGMSKATYAAKSGVQQIGSSFQSLGNIAAEVGGKFGEFGGIVGTALGTAGQAISKLVKEAGQLNGIGGVLKIGAIGFGAFAAGAVTAGAAVVGIAVHASESAKRLYELSQSTGTSVKELSGLSVIGNLVGISTDMMARGLERLDRNAITAIQRPTGQAALAFKNLGISLTDAAGKTKGTSELFTEIAGKFSQMEDGATKTGLAMQIFGRAGAELIPLLNKGAEATKYWIDYATQVGAVLDEKAAKGATAFQEELAKLSLISEGVQNKLMVALLPALDHITQALATFLAHGDAIQRFGEVVGKVLVDIAKIVFEAGYAWDWWGSKIDIWNAKIAKSSIDFWLFLGKKPTEKTKAILTEIDNTIKKGTDDIQRSRDKLALIMSDLESKAVGPAAPEAKGPKKAGPTISATGTGGLKPVTDEVLKYTQGLANAIEEQRKWSDSFGMTAEQIKQQNADIAANIEVDKIREGLVSKQIAIEDRLTAAKAEHTATSDRQVTQLKAENDAITKQITELDGNRAQIVAMIKEKKALSDDHAFADRMADEHNKIQAEIAGLQAETAVIFAAGAARRQAAAELEAGKLTAGHPEYDKERLAADILARNQAQETAKIEQELAKTSDAELQYQIDLIHQVMAAHEDDYNVQLAGNAKILALQNQVKQTWDTEALAVGTFGDKAKAVFNELQIESQNTGKKIAESFKTAFDGVSKNIADMVVTGKSNFQSLFTSLEQQITQALVSKALNDLLAKLGNMFGGNDQSDNPGITTGPNPPGGGGGGGGFLSGITNFIGSLFEGKASGGPVAPGVGYIVGERGPEAFIPTVQGTIVPNSGTMKTSPMQGNVNVHVYGATDPDSFRKATPQIAASIYQNMRLAAARNAGAM